MDKNIYDLINHTETNLQDYEFHNLTELEELRMKQFVQKNIKNKDDKKNYKLKNTAVAVAAATVLMMGSVTGVAVASMENPTAYRIASFLGIDKNLDSYETVINQSVTKKGVTLELKEVILNQDELMISVISSSSEYSSSQFECPGGMVYINGEEINAGSMGSIKQIDENTAQSLIRFPLKKSYEGDLNVKVELSTPLSGTLMNSSPHWTFKFRTSGDQLSKNTFSQAINQTMSLPNGTNMTLTNYSENDISCIIGFSLDNTLDGQGVSIMGTDEFGNVVEFNLDGITSSEGKFILVPEQRGTLENTTTLNLNVMLDGSPIGEPFAINR